MFPGPLRAFHEVAQAGSIRGAAEKLGLSPSSVSRQIVALETVVGTSLLRRSRSGVVLTHAGNLVAAYAKSAVADFDALRIDLNDLRGSQGLIRLALVESIVSSGPLRAANSLRASFPGIKFEVQILPATGVEEAIIEQRCDIGITFCFEPRVDVVVDGRIAEPLMLACSPDHPLQSAHAITLKDLLPFPLGLPARTFGVRRLIDRVANSADVALDPALTSNAFEVLCNFAQTDAGVAILPKRALDSAMARGALKSISFAHPEFNDTTLDVIRLRQRRVPRIIRLYSEMLRQQLEAPPLGQGVKL